VARISAKGTTLVYAAIHREQTARLWKETWENIRDSAGKSLEKAIEELVQEQRQRQANACFAAGTPVLTPSGYTTIERLRPGDQVLSRPEGDAQAETEVAVVAEAFVYVAPVMRLRVGGRDIRTTAEHPFFVVNHGWRPANELRPRDLLSSHDGKTVEVESITETDETITVYNVSLADYHT
jgi:hypothetical protein